MLCDVQLPCAREPAFAGHPFDVRIAGEPSPSSGVGRRGRPGATAGRFDQVSQRGSHRKMRLGDGRTAGVPVHRELATGTLPPSCAKPRLGADEFEALR